MKNTSSRQQSILNLLLEKKDLTVAEIQQSEGISMATAYREIQSIVMQGLAAKTVGGITRNQKTPGNCFHCGRDGSPRESFIIEKKDGSRANACCPHCGLLAIKERNDINSAMTIDFFYGTLLSASQAWYVINSSIAPCCRPSVLTFADPTDAQRLTQAFGGEVTSFPEALEKIKNLMEL
ncbi:MAG: DeoR family transcriptional regulator [Chloroflexota bacterium]